MVTGPISYFPSTADWVFFARNFYFHTTPSYKRACVRQTIALLVVTAGPNKVLTFAGGPAVYEHEWNQIPSARGEQPYVSAIAGIIHDSSHLALLFLG